MLLDHPGQRSDGDRGHLDAGERLDVVVGNAEEAVLEVEELAGHVDREDLALAVPRHLVPIGEAAEQQRADLRRLAFAQHIGGGLERAVGEREAPYRLLAGFVDRRPGFEAADRALDAFMNGHVETNSRRKGAGAS